MISLLWIRRALERQSPNQGYSNVSTLARYRLVYWVPTENVASVWLCDWQWCYGVLEDYTPVSTNLLVENECYDGKNSLSALIRYSPRTE